MYCKYCGKEIKEGEVCDCRTRNRTKKEKNKNFGMGKLLVILAFVFSFLGMISIILLRTILTDILTENIVIEDIYKYLLYLVPGFFGILALLCAGFSMQDQRVRKVSVAAMTAGILLIAGTGLTGILWPYEPESYEADVEEDSEEEDTEEEDVQEEQKKEGEDAEEEKPENKEKTEETDKETETKDSGFTKIKEDYEKGLLDIDGAQKALDEINTENASEEEIDQILAFQEQLEADYEKQIMESEKKEKQNADQASIGQEMTSNQMISSASMSAVATVSATSALSEYNMTHSSDRIMDNDTSTAWVEGVSGQGEGESVIFTFDGVYKVSGFVIYGGYQKNSDLYYKNSRPASLKVMYSDGSSQICNLSDTLGAQTFTLANPVETSSITFTIQSVYAGNKYEDTVISEISIF